MRIRKNPTVVKAEGQGYVVEYTTERGKEQVRHLTYLQAHTDMVRGSGMISCLLMKSDQVETASKHNEI